MSMMGKLKFFLGLQIRKVVDGIYIHQMKYVKVLLKKFKLENCKITSSRVDQGQRKSLNRNEVVPARPTPSQPSEIRPSSPCVAAQQRNKVQPNWACPASSSCSARLYIRGAMHFLWVLEFTLDTLSLYLFLRSRSSIQGGAQCCIGISLDRGSVGLRLGS
ncbi:hypothetical protein CR513_03939, partial [Mucuna pruriens]